MTREIKFRAWDKENKEMCYNDTFDGDSVYRGSLASINISLENDSFKFMQFTGLKDKNEKPIFEGDIVNVLNNTATVFYQAQDNFAGWSLEQITGDRKTFYNWEKQLFDWNFCEVIGNIYENPELLEKKND